MRTVIVLTVVCALAPVVSAGQRANFGAQMALGIQQEMFGSGPSSNVHLGLLQLHLPVTLVFTDSRPRFQFITEAGIGPSLEPSERLFFGTAGTFRYHLRPERDLGWYLDIGAGIYSVALQVRELDGWMQYTLHIGGGLRVAHGPGFLNVGYRLTHFSNNGTIMPNPGLNFHTTVIGYTVPFN